jgi:hypothetical protein
MGFRLESQYTDALVNAALNLAVETEMLALYKLGIPVDNAQVACLVDFTLTPGANATDVTLQIYRGSIAGAIVCGWWGNLLVTPAALFHETLFIVDSPGIAGELEYHVTAIMANATANSPIAFGQFFAFVL